MVFREREGFSFEGLARLTGLALIGRAFFYWLSLIGIMHSYAERGEIDEKSGIFLFTYIFLAASAILGIYLLDLGLIKVRKKEKKPLITLRKEIPKKRVQIFLAIELIITFFILLNIPELPKLWIILIIEIFTLLYSLVRE